MGATIELTYGMEATGALLLRSSRFAFAQIALLSFNGSVAAPVSGYNRRVPSVVAYVNGETTGPSSSSWEQAD